MEQLLEDSLDVVQIIEEALAANDPYNCDIPYDIVRLSDCDFPDHIQDPLALLRLLFGNERVQEWEYAEDLESIADALRTCTKRLRSEPDVLLACARRLSSQEAGEEEGCQSAHCQEVQG